MSIFLLFPIHIFSNIDLLKNKKLYLIEESRFFIDFKYHKLKLAYHRATMKYYFDYLKSKSIDIHYIQFNEDLHSFYKKLNKSKVETYDLCDNVLKNKLLKLIPHINILQTPNFLIYEILLKENINKFYNGKKYNHQNFYKWQRIRLNILVEKDGNPIGGKWSFDEDNRKKLPTNIHIPKIINKQTTKYSKYITEAKIYIENNFPDNYGSLDNFIYPITYDDSIKWCENFLKTKFENFGLYEDAVSDKDPFLFHSVLSPMMNIGLLTDTEVINMTLKYQHKIPLNSFEGFIRQIIGWRNYIYSIYLLEGDKLCKMNFFKHSNKLNKKVMWNGGTNILPIDNIINKINEYSYAHHIERLMYLGNYMLLCMINPKDVYEIFMEWTIDAYEWVMIPNVYSMSQYADGGLIMTRPYFSSSNYILSMSNYKKNEWCKLWDCLYYNFINKHKTYLSKNYSTSRQVAFWNKKSTLEQKNIIKIANNYLKKIE
jgi:deoxyribodipyrimidine photolyase-related protein